MKKLLIIIIAAFLIFSFCSCKKNDKTINSEMSNTVSLTENTENSDITDLYTVTQNDRVGFSYSFSDLDGNILFENDKKGYYKKYKLENVSSMATDFTTDCKFDEHGNIVVTYLTGDDFIEKDYIIYLQ